jgi:hypothetical protein
LTSRIINFIIAHLTAQFLCLTVVGDTSETQSSSSIMAEASATNGSYAPVSSNAELQVDHSASGVEIICGPLINYKGLKSDGAWLGTVLIVTKPGVQQTSLQYRSLGAVNGGGGSTESHSIDGIRLYETTNEAFWRFNLEIQLQDFEAKWEYSIPGAMIAHQEGSPESTPTPFYVPSRTQSMRIMFHSCNGFSVGTDEEAFSGPALWNDVLRVHAQKPFHVMIGGGDQIYNDGVRVKGPLAEWTNIQNPHKRRHYPFPEELRAKCDKYYYDNYIRWYTTGKFATANGQIPQVNIWDDHDIIDGFGSYVDAFMRCAVFRGIGGIAHKYYCLFQHHIPPPKSTYTTDSAVTEKAQEGLTSGADPNQLKDVFVLEGAPEDPSFIMGQKPGPYVEERSRSLFMRLGARIGFVGVDARTERTRHQINYPETYDLIFNRLRAEINAAGQGSLKHLIVLLGVPIAYPRLVWLENILSSPIIGPIRFLNRRFGIAGGLFNTFDGGVDLLDDLDDHYCARTHKKERNLLVTQLQHLAKENNIRVSILGGDVHLGAMGRFYSKPKLGLEIEKDHRYMVNIISSAITNKPPPQAIANLLARRNKIHHFDHDTDETLMKLFDKDPGNMPKPKTNTSNNVTMPSRNYACITECIEASQPAVTTSTGAVDGGENHAVTNGATTNGATTNGATTNGTVRNGATKLAPHTAAEGKTGKTKDGHLFLGGGEAGAGTTHPAADGVSTAGVPGALDISLRVEINQHDPEGHTDGYGFYSESTFALTT